MTPTPAGRHQPSFPGAPRSRRAVLKLGFASAVALVVNACGGSSKSTASTTTGAAAGGPTTTAAAAAPAGPPIRTGSQLTIDFTYTPGAGGFGPARNP